MMDRRVKLEMKIGEKFCNPSNIRLLQAENYFNCLREKLGYNEDKICQGNSNQNERKKYRGKLWKITLKYRE